MTKPSDVYLEYASIAFAVPYDQVTTTQRKLFKERAFLIVYDQTTNKDNFRERLQALANIIRAQRRTES